MVDISEITIGQLSQLMSSPLLGAVLSRQPADPSTDVWEVGKTYLIRTVTMIDTGVLVAVTPQELVLEQAAWIADTGRFSDAVRLCEFSEVEPFPDGRVIIGRGSIIDAVVIDRAPRHQK